MLGQLFHVVGYMPLAYLASGRPVVIANFNATELVEIIRQERVSGFFAIAKRAGDDRYGVQERDAGGIFWVIRRSRPRKSCRPWRRTPA